MSDEKDVKPLLADELTQMERVLLSRIVHDPGFKVLQKLFDSACTRATEDIVKLNPEELDYERRVAERQRKARSVHWFSELVRKSVIYHVDRIKTQDNVEEKQVVDAVNQTIGIFPAKPGTKISAIEKTFGIHPARPVKNGPKAPK